ncbi:hypothetical protein Csa_002524, partial [Cucumis sativus]
MIVCLKSTIPLNPILPARCDSSCSVGVSGEGPPPTLNVETNHVARSFHVIERKRGPAMTPPTY